MSKVYPVILCGGLSTRLWPAQLPKQFMKLFGDNTLVQETIIRATQILDNAEPPLLVTNQTYLKILTQQVKEINAAYTGIIAEPVSRNTGPAVLMSALHLAQYSSLDDIIVLMPSDHQIEDLEGMKAGLQRAVKLAKLGAIVVLGIKPTGPSSQFGYIEPDELIPKAQGELTEAYSIKQFVEKPSVAEATKLIKNNHAMWNAGIYVMKVSTALHMTERLSGDFFSKCVNAYESSFQTAENLLILEHRYYHECPSEPFDKVVMEKCDNGMVVEAHFDWQDLGTWDALMNSRSNKDGEGNVIEGNILTDQVKNCYLHSETGKTIIVLGVDDLIVVETESGLLVSRRDMATEIRSFAKTIFDK